MFVSLWVATFVDGEKGLEEKKPRALLPPPRQGRGDIEPPVLPPQEGGELGTRRRAGSGQGETASPRFRLRFSWRAGTGSCRTGTPAPASNEPQSRPSSVVPRRKRSGQRARFGVEAGRGRRVVRPVTRPRLRLELPVGDARADNLGRPAPVTVAGDPRRQTGDSRVDRRAGRSV